jgi:ubiquinone/menaquinone biosynthesis C-methylase UbiE
MSRLQDVKYDGIPVLLRYSDIEHERSQYAKEWKAVELAKANGWRRALEALYDRGMVKYSTSPERLKFIDLLPLSKDMTALEIGIGFGQHTAAIAERVKQLDTLEIRLVNAVFARIRCEQDGVDNVSFFCGGDDCRLPFPDNSYDAVLLNLVLEWCAGENQDEPAPVAQTRLLAEIRRVLRPGGLLQLNTKNRFAYKLLMGRGDEHAHDIPFGHALPRFLLRLITRWTGKGRPPGYLHSYTGLKRLLRRAGLVPIASYWAVPEMRYPDRLVPTEAHAIRAARPQLARLGESRLTNLLMHVTPASLVKHVAPGLFFVARKP